MSATLGSYLISDRSPRCVVVTGASSGLGAGLARSYARPGRVLGLVGRDPSRLAAVAAVCGGLGATVHAARLDVGDAVAMADWLERLDAVAPVELAVANAAVSGGTGPDGTTESLAAATTLVRTNLLGAMHTIGPLLPRMLARGGGHLAVVASVAAYRGLADSPAYCAAKAGVRLYGESLRTALKPRGIAVSVILPGFFTSPMSQRHLGARPLCITLEEAVARVRYGLDRRHRRIVFPRRLGLLLQAADLLPAWLGDSILRRARFCIVPAQDATSRTSPE